MKRAHVTSTPQRRGLDDGPPLPSESALKRAYRKIDATATITDADRLNWLEARKYTEFGIGHDGGAFAIVVMIGRDRFYGPSLRAAIDAAMKEATT